MPATTPKPRGSYARGRATCEEIVNVARDVLVERGYYGMTFVAVAERAGITRAGLIHHFPTKEHLLTAVMEDRFLENGEWFIKKEAELGDLMDTVVALTQRHTENPAGATLLVALAGASVDPNHPAHAWYVDRYAFLQSRMTEALASDQSAGRIRADVDVDVLAIELLALMEGALVIWFHRPESFDPVALMANFVASKRP